MKRGWFASMVACRGVAALLVALCGLIVCPGAGAADDPAGTGTPQGILALGAGFRFVTEDGGGETLSPNDPLESSPTAWGNYSRLAGETAIDLSFWYGGGAAYGLSGRYQSTGLLSLGIDVAGVPYNVERLDLPRMVDGYVSTRSGVTTVLLPVDWNPGDDYRMDVAQQKAAASLGVPGYPAWISLAARRYTTDGQVQSVFREPRVTGLFERYIVSTTRDVSTETVQVDAGGNAHLGYVNLAYSFHGLRYEDAEGVPTYDVGLARGIASTGDYEHDGNPEVTSSEHRVVVSTGGTGRLEMVASATAGERENEELGVSRSYLRGDGAVHWRPTADLTVALRFSSKKVEDEATGEDAVEVRTDDDIPLSFDTTETAYVASAVYQPTKWVRLKGTASLKTVERSDAEAHDVPDDTDTTTWKIVARLKPSTSLTVDLTYKGSSVDDPAHDTLPERTSEGSIAAGWKPGKSLSAQALLRATSAQNDDSDLKSSRLFADLSMAWMAAPAVSIGMGANYFRDAVNTPVEFGDEVALSPDAPYRAQGGQVFLTATVRPSERLSLTASAGLLVTEGTLDLDDADGYEVVGDLASFEDTRQNYAVEAIYDVGSGWSVNGRAAYARNVGTGDTRDEDLGELALAFTKAW